MFDVLLNYRRPYPRICCTKTDPNENKVDRVGVYKDEQGNTPILTSIAKAQTRLLETETSKPTSRLKVLQVLLMGYQVLLGNDSRALLRTALLRFKHQVVVAHFVSLLSFWFAVMTMPPFGLVIQHGQIISHYSVTLVSPSKNTRTLTLPQALSNSSK